MQQAHTHIMAEMLQHMYQNDFMAQKIVRMIEEEFALSECQNDNEFSIVWGAYCQNDEEELAELHSIVRFASIS